MPFELPSLPFASDALEPYFSKETLEYHHGKHHAGYVEKLNKLIAGTSFEKKALEEVIIEAREKKLNDIFNNASQHWNHSFFWKCLSPNSTMSISAALAKAVDKSFGTMEEFKSEFSARAGKLFGSGWVWLTKDEGGHLELLSTQNAENPVGLQKMPLLTCDLWEHAYYIDYRNDRSKYMDAIWRLINWEFVQKQFER